ncbi:hypothetical protein HMPREF1553_00186 [Porphyromonas gingivalis F0568]|nr:hypothetical protein HMPREF1553_00186 [Porphyromonas gingivalis F0568]
MRRGCSAYLLRQPVEGHAVETQIYAMAPDGGIEGAATTPTLADPIACLCSVGELGSDGGLHPAHNREPQEGEAKASVFVARARVQRGTPLLPMLRIQCLWHD